MSVGGRAGGPAGPARGTVLHVAPHPDDEALGAPATLLALRDAGHRVVNLALGLGRPGQETRRGAELREACARARFELEIAREAPTTGDAALGGWAATRIDDALDAHAPVLVIGPAPTDAHPRHAEVGAALRDAVDRRGAGAPRLWRWSLWSTLPRPTLLLPFGEERLAEAAHLLAAHASEIARLDLPRLLHARAELAAVTGPELVGGFGGAVVFAGPYAELLAADEEAGALDADDPLTGR